MYLPRKVYSLLGISLFRFKPVTLQPDQLLLRSQVFLHACQTPVTALKCSAAVLRQQLEDNQQLQEPLRSLEQSIADLERLITAVSFQGVGKHAYFLLRPTVANVVGLLRWKYPLAEIYMHIPDDIRLSGNRVYFEEALRCVVSNGLEAYQRTNTQTMYIFARKRRAAIQLDIIDSGLGMNSAAKRLALLNGVSYKAEGSGIGLQFARLTVEKLFEGKMVLASQLGVGTRVTWIIPMD